MTRDEDRINRVIGGDEVFFPMPALKVSGIGNELSPIEDTPTTGNLFPGIASRIDSRSRLEGKEVIDFEFYDQKNNGVIDVSLCPEHPEYKESFLMPEEVIVPGRRVLSRTLDVEWKDNQYLSAIIIADHNTHSDSDDNTYRGRKEVKNYTPLILFDKGETKPDGTLAGVIYEHMSIGPPTVKWLKENVPDYKVRRYSYINQSLLTFKDSIDSFTKPEAKETKMANKIVDMMKADTKEAAYRVVSTQITTGAKAGLIKLFQSKGGDSAQMAILQGLLDSEMGESIIALMIGYGLNYAPGFKDKPQVIKLAEEFRVRGMTTAGNAVMEMAMGSLLPVLTTALNALPEETSNVRVVGAHSEQEEEEEETTKGSVKSASR